MNTLKDALYENIGKIQHLRTYEFLKIIEKSCDPDGVSRITYKRWKDEFGIHAFILNCCVEESQKLGLIEVIREGRDGKEKEGTKGVRRVYRLLLGTNNPVEKVAEKPMVPKDNHTTAKKASKKKVVIRKKKPPVPAKKKIAKKKVSSK